MTLTAKSIAKLAGMTHDKSEGTVLDNQSLLIFCTYFLAGGNGPDAFETLNNHSLDHLDKICSS